MRHAALMVGLILLTTIVASWAWPSATATTLQSTDTSAMSDPELMSAFASTDKETAHQAVVEVMKRGERLIPLLMQRKGDKRPFWGYGLGDPNSAFLRPLPSGNAKRDESRVLTIEVAALYLISAIFYESLEFAQAAYLTDDTPVKEHRFNTVARVSAAWRSVEPWSERLKTEGLKALRSRKDSPLGASKTRFWGE